MFMLSQFGYLNYIVQNYNHLPEVVVFSQGSLHDHLDLYPSGPSATLLGSSSTWRMRLRRSGAPKIITTIGSVACRRIEHSGWLWNILISLIRASFSASGSRPM